MSWQDYVDKQLLASGFVNHAAIIGTDGSLWAKSAAFNVRDFFDSFSHLAFVCRVACLLNYQPCCDENDVSARSGLADSRLIFV